MNFEYQQESLTTDNLDLDYFYVPWDSEIFNFPIAQISKITVSNCEEARKDFDQYRIWCDQHKIKFTSCRIPQDKLTESMFLEEEGFRFIELNYRPIITNLQSINFPDTMPVKIDFAEKKDMNLLSKISESIFCHERFHKDPKVDSKLANKRYRIWLENAFHFEHQTVLKFVYLNKIIGFCVVEFNNSTHCYWSLNGIGTEYHGKGLGRQAWKAMLKHHKQDTFDTVSTSITSHNVAVFNLYASLGFKFPLPYLTFRQIHSV